MDGFRDIDRLVERAGLDAEIVAVERFVPQSGQKAQRMRRPLLASRVQNFGVPCVTRIVPAGMVSDMPKAELDWCRHSVQWQT